MVSCDNATKMLLSGNFDENIIELYSCNTEKVGFYRQRFLNLIKNFKQKFGDCEDISIFSTPGRTEIGGNHTDHQNGKVLAAAVNLDSIAAASMIDHTKIRVFSESYDMISVDLSDLSPRETERNTSAGILRGICAKFKEIGFTVGGFDAYVSSDILKGSGLSSSAAFEVLLCSMINSFYCGDSISPIQLAKISHFAENIYFGKPSGLMDQMVCAVGGFVQIDFQNINHPVVKKIDFDFQKSGYVLCIVDTKGSHADLTADYAAITSEMHDVAEQFGKTKLSEVDRTAFYDNLGELRKKVSDRAILRATHFFRDNALVLKEADALKRNDFEAFCKNVISSGQSSFMFLQNVYSCSNPNNQGLAVALSICDRLLTEKGAYRVHGGGFAGTIQTFVPKAMLEEFCETMENAMGKGTCRVISVRTQGAVRIL